MELGRLPLDAVRAIATYLDLGQLALLYATFDRSMQRSLSSAQVVDTVRIGRAGTVNRGLKRLFIKSIRDANAVQFDKEVKWSPDELSTLATLNPRSLTLSSSMIDSSAMPLMKALSKNPQDDALREQTRNLTWFLWPNLALLCPRLTHLTVGAESTLQGLSANHICHLDTFGLERMAELILLPPSLTSVTLEEMPLGDSTPYLLLFPPTLRSLSVSFLQRSLEPPLLQDVDLSALLLHFTSIETLTITGGNILERETTGQAPKTLTKLTLNTAADIPLSTFHNLNFRESNLETLVIGLETLSEALQPPKSPRNLNCNLLPPTLVNLDIRHDQSSTISISSDATLYAIPPSITNLAITLHHLDDPIIPTLKFMTFLKRLELRALFRRGLRYKQTLEIVSSKEILNSSRSSSVLSISASDLPPSLTSLTVAEAPSSASLPISFEAIGELPTSLLILRVPAFDLVAASLFHMYLPECRLDIVEPIEFWDNENGALLRNFNVKLCAPVFDFQLWSDAVIAHYSDMNVHFKVTSTGNIPKVGMPATKALIAKASLFNHYGISAEQYLSYNFPHHALRAFPSLIKLEIDLPSCPVPLKLHGSSMPTLTHLDLGRTPHSNFITLPFDSLRYLAAKSTIELSGDYRTVSDDLTHVDAPHWSFLAENVLRWPLKEMKMLRCTIRDFADYGVIDFLTKDVSADTRMNMAVSIEYNVTGSLLMEGSDFSQRHLRYEDMRDETLKLLTQRLLSPMPVEAHLRTATLSKGLLEPIGKVVTSIKMQHERGRGVPFCLPPSATSLSLNTGNVIALASNIGQLRANTFRSTSPFGPSLTALDLTLVENVKGWWRFLPNTLTYLKVHGAEPLPDWGVHNFPPNLETLVLISTASSTLKGYSTLTFRFSELPFSLTRLAIVAPSTVLHVKDSESSDVFSGLPRLAHFMLIGESVHASTLLYKRLPKETLQSFFIGHPEGTPSYFISSMASSVVASLQSHPKMIYCFRNNERLPSLPQQQVPFDEAMKSFEL